MSKGAEKLVRVCAGVQRNESVLIVTDVRQDFSISEALSQAITNAAAQATVVIMSQVKTDSGEPNASVTAAMKAADVIFMPVSVSVTHTHAVKDACAAGARIVAMTQWTADMMKGGGIEADFAAIEPRVRAVAKILDEGDAVRVETKAGTDLRLDIRGRLGSPHAKTGIVRKGDFHPVPDIEAPVSPVSAEGRIVCDGSIPYLGIGVLQEPVTLEVRDGNVVSIEGGAAAKTVRESWEAMNDPRVYNVAELGIGMNPKCRLIGVMLEDEGVANTCHIGVGTSITLGGTVKAPCHYDFVLRDPTIDVDGIRVMDEGKMLIGSGA